MDDIHFRVTEPSPTDSSWNFHKLGGLAVTYEVSTNIMTGNIFGFNGPFPAEKWPDINTFKIEPKRCYHQEKKF